MTNICGHPRHDNRKRKQFNQILKIFSAFLECEGPSALVRRSNNDNDKKHFLNFLKILHCELHQWSPLDFNLTLNCLDSYIAPKLKQRRWRPQRFVCPLKPCGRSPRLPPTVVATRATASLRSLF